MKAIKLSFEDSGLFGTKVTHARCDFLQNNLESFMQMYKTQGSTFWLRFLMSFRSYLERKFACTKQTKHISHLNEIQFLKFVRVLNYIFIHIHKKLIEGSNTSVKKFIKNMIVLGLNSPEYLKLAPKKWLNHLTLSKPLQNVLQNLLGLPEASEYNDFIVLLYTMYAEFVSSITALFEQWYSSCDLSEEELKKVDSKIIYWLPNVNIDDKNWEPLCFEKYLSDYWKENLQKMLLIEHVHGVFSKHSKKKCCENFDKDKNIFHIFNFTSRATFSLMKIMYDDDIIDEKESPIKDKVKTITDVSLTELYVLKPHVEACEKHKGCYMLIRHDESCLEPYICDGSSPCVITCKNLKKQNKKVKDAKYWKNVTAQVFSFNKKKRDVCTLAESSDRCIETYMNIRGKSDLDLSLSMLKYFTSQYVNEWNHLDFNRRKNECLDRLRRKLREKQNMNSETYEREAFKESFCRMTLMEDANAKLFDMEMQYCFSRDDSEKCEGSCFKRDCVNTIGINSSDAFGRVVCLAKTCITISQCCSVHNSIASQMNCCGDSRCKNKSVLEAEDSVNSCLRKHLIPNCSDKNVQGASVSDSKIDTGCQTINCTKVNKDVKQKKTKDSKVGKDVEQVEANNFKLPDDVSKSLKEKFDLLVNVVKQKNLDVLCGVVPERTKNKKIINEIEEIKVNESKDNKVEQENYKDDSKAINETEESKATKLIADDEILTAIGMSQCKTAVNQQEVGGMEIENKESPGVNQLTSEEDRVAENFFNLISGTKAAPLTEIQTKKYPETEKVVESKKVKLKICACCRKQEAVRKTFKRCSKCKEENFPEQRYYCSRECLIEDWIESHEDEHLKNKK